MIQGILCSLIPCTLRDDSRDTLFFNTMHFVMIQGILCSLIPCTLCDNSRDILFFNLNTYCCVTTSVGDYVNNINCIKMALFNCTVLFRFKINKYIFISLAMANRDIDMSNILWRLYNFTALKKLYTQL